MIRSRHQVVSGVVAVVMAIGCNAPHEDRVANRSASEQLTAEFEEEVNPAAVTRTLELAKTVTAEARAAGIDKLVTALKQTLRGVDTSSLDKIVDFTLGDPLPGNTLFNTFDTGTRQVASARTGPNEKYFHCPPLGLRGAKSCAELVDRALVQVKNDVDVQGLLGASKRAIELDPLLSKQSQLYRDYAESYVSDLSLTLHRFGMDVAAIRAEYTLRDAGVCDHEQLDGEEIARLRGIKEAEIIVRQLVDRETVTLAPRGRECLAIGPAGKETEALIDEAVERYVAEHEMCSDMSRTNQSRQILDEARREGIDRGIDAFTTTTWIWHTTDANNFNPSSMDSYKVAPIDIVANIDGCKPKDIITDSTSPLVIDLDNDGLELTTDRVRFDLRATGQLQRVTWAGKNEGFLALDLNGDGRITCGRELFGNRSICAGERCADGAEALALYDCPSEGGNEDGKIDPSDAVFSSLRIWVDANHDGRSQPVELRGLPEHGIRSVSLQATPLTTKVDAGHISLSLQVETNRGLTTAYDVWFDNRAVDFIRNPTNTAIVP